MKRLSSNIGRRAIFFAASSALALSASDRAAAQATAGPDSIKGGAGADVIGGLGGDDTIWGGDGADSLSGGANYDELYGENGNDLLNGDGGDDALIGGNDADVLNGGGGPDFLVGEGGDDALAGGDHDDDLRGGPGADVMQGGAGKDLFHGGAFSGTDGLDSFDGGPGVDRVSFYSRDATQGASADLASQTIANDGFGNAESMTGIEELGAGTQYADVFLGDAGKNAIWGMSGDTIDGRDGNDTLGANGAPALADGGAGFDCIYFQSQRLFDKNGDGKPEQDTASAGVAVDLAAAKATDGWGGLGQVLNVECVFGSPLADTLKGGAAGERLTGELGDDLLDGGEGPDTLSGGDGADVFAYDSTADSPPGSAKRDTIVAFSTGADKIDLSAVNAGVYSNVAAFTGGGAPEYLIAPSGAAHLVRADDNGDGKIDMTIRVLGVVAPNDVVP
jgi:Ca2+-binding RTX toxin-like protein